MAHLDISHRVERLRQWMAEHQIDAMIVPTNDPHDSEYPAEYWLCRAWLTGFDGSAGTAVVTATAAALWTDSRYFLQAASQLDGTPFELMRDGEPTTPSLPEWIASQTLGETPAQGEVRIGCTAEIFMADLFDTLAQHNADFRPVATPDPFALIWPDRPALPASPIYRHEAQWTGASVGEKIAHAWAAYDKKGEKADFIVLNDLAEVAWLLNLRASDIEFNPVFYAYLVLGREGAHLFTALGRLDPAIAESLQQEGVACHEYAEIYDFIAARQDAHLTYGCPARMHRGLVAQLEAAPCQLITVINAVGQLKARKNSAELAGFRQAMLADGVALVRFLRWIEEQGQQQRLPELTEYAVSEQLRAFRAENADFIGLSFATIAGYAAHGAIVHYEAEAEGSAHLAPRGLLLLDSGAQYRSGTTDITRTLALGSLSDEERLAYTLVLKGHIALSRMRFPEGTTGLQLDTAARYAMWQEGYDYGHGTGHGVGAHLCVNEGPMQIRKNLRDCTTLPFEAGMVVSNEPGIYVAERFGVRIENLLAVLPSESTPFGRFHRFETLTLCPYDTRPILTERLTADERNWLNAYHAHVRTTLTPLLADAADRAWLEQATAAI